MDLLGRIGFDGLGTLGMGEVGVASPSEPTAQFLSEPRTKRFMHSTVGLERRNGTLKLAVGLIPHPQSVLTEPFLSGRIIPTARSMH